MHDYKLLDVVFVQLLKVWNDFIKVLRHIVVILEVSRNILFILVVFQGYFCHLVVLDIFLSC